MTDAPSPSRWIGFRLRCAFFGAFLAVAHSSTAVGSGQPDVLVIGQSVQGREITALLWNDQAEQPATLVLGAVHGDERESGVLAELLAARWQRNPSLLGGKRVILIPKMNPDGWDANSRGNARGVDLNRNFSVGWEKKKRGRWDYSGTAPLSEPEARAVHALMQAGPIERIVTLHSCRTCGGVNNFDGPARRLAILMRQFNGYRVLDEWPSPTPGSFGTFAGKHSNIPTITLEMPRNKTSEDDFKRSAAAIEALITAVERVSSVLN
ncbi:MAG: DUF2817 domain-containing protein [Chromatiales bacterium]|jgi:murein peptide amidase A|nr:DUF2817 domain-containing protein [Chromatiales bacterium]